jgi:hypothetical protein
MISNDDFVTQFEEDEHWSGVKFIYNKNFKLSKYKSFIANCSVLQDVPLMKVT